MQAAAPANFREKNHEQVDVDNYYYGRCSVVRFSPIGGVGRTVGLGFYLRCTNRSRVLFSNHVGIDLGVGMNFSDHNKPSQSFELGVPVTLHRGERSLLFLRLSGLLGLNKSANNPDYNYFDRRQTTLDIILGPEAQVFFGNNFSVQVSHGFILGMEKPDGYYQDDFGGYSTTYVEPEWKISGGTFGAGLTVLGFHYYF